MSQKSAIQWTDATWNVARGCTKVDEDCKYCYMYRDSMNNTRYNPLQVVRTKTVFDLPLKLKEPSKIFTCSLTDFFHEAIDGYRDDAWNIIRKCPEHTFQILTKRPERITACTPPDLLQADNIWFGTSVGSMEGYDRILHLIEVNCKTRFLSLEPLHGPMNLYPLLSLTNEIRTNKPGSAIDWVIVGGESGNDTGKYRYRPCELEWIQSIAAECIRHRVPVFVKQMGTYLAKQLKMSDRHGGNIDEFPEHLKIREFPHA